ncbi:MAG: competence protein CoiA family protein [Promethearchaeota archaeon]
MKKLPFISTAAESKIHKALKELIYQKVCENNDIVNISLEKYFGNRFADIYFKLNSNQHVVIEIQNSPITVKEIIHRTKDYNQKGIYVLWILHGKGSCVASPKAPRDEKGIKISPAESFLHKMYGGRVYYINFIQFKKKFSITTPFAIHYSKLLDKRKRGMLKSRFYFFFYRNSNFVDVPSWKLLCTEFSGFKIARFYDKNLKSVLKEEILKQVGSTANLVMKEKRFLKEILDPFKKKYGMYIILNELIELVKQNEISLSYKLIKKIRRKIF